VLFKEALVGLANGIANGLVAAVIVCALYGFTFRSLLLGGIIAAAMVTNMFIAGIAGTIIPIVLKRLKADPALASTVFVTTCTDVGGFFAFLGLATLLLRFLK
jgi:magnesium transporter